MSKELPLEFARIVRESSGNSQEIRKSWGLAYLTGYLNSARMVDKDKAPDLLSEMMETAYQISDTLNRL